MRYLFFILFILTGISSQAGHLVGGEISYIQVNGDTYVIQLRMYRDCYASGNSVQQFDPVAYVSVYNAAGNQLISVFELPRPNDSTRLPLVVEVPCLPDPPDLCILEMIYSDTVVIDVPPNGVHLVNQRCCRTPNAVNLINPSQFGSTYTAFIPGSNLTTSNSSPSFNEVPPIALCTGLYLELDYSATDPDGDSLSYSFCTPLHGGGSGGNNGTPLPDTPSAPPFDTVAWANGFGPNYQISSAPPFEINHSTGIITGRPSQLGTYVFGVCVTEYRNNLKLGVTRRDFQVTTTLCEVEAAAAIDSAIEECIGLELQFFNISTLGKSFIWDFGDPTTTLDTSTQSNPVYNYPDTGLYKIRLIAIGAVGCSDTTFMEYRVLPRIEPDFEVPDPQCFDRQKYDLIHSGYARPTTNIIWQIDSINYIMESEQIGLLDFAFPTTGLHEVMLIYEDFGCVKKYAQFVDVLENPQFTIDPPFAESCSPFLNQYEATATFAGAPHYLWYLDDTLISDSSFVNINSKKEGYHRFKVVMMTDSLCIDTVTNYYPKHFLVKESPHAKIYVENPFASMFIPEFTVVDSSAKAQNISFYLDSVFHTNRNEFELILEDTGDYHIMLVAEHENGCIDTAFDTLRVSPEYLFYTPNSFTPDGDGTNDIWYPNIFLWEKYNLVIYDRWGHEVYTATHPLSGWNGKMENLGDDCPIGVYSYTIEVTEPIGRYWKTNGIIALLR